MFWSNYVNHRALTCHPFDPPVIVDPRRSRRQVRTSVIRRRRLRRFTREHPTPQLRQAVEPLHREARSHDAPTEGHNHLRGRSTRSRVSFQPREPRVVPDEALTAGINSCYSAQEHASYQRTPSLDPSSSSSSSSSSSTTRTSNTVSLPTDIILETLLSVLILCYGLVLGSPALRPVSWHVWAGEVERKEKSPRQGEDAGPDLAGVNPFASLESRIRVSWSMHDLLAGSTTIAHLCVGKEEGV